MNIPERKPEHVWQDFRMRCLELAVRGGASTATPEAIEASQRIEIYILTKSDIEKQLFSQGDEDKS